MDHVVAIVDDVTSSSLIGEMKRTASSVERASLYLQTMKLSKEKEAEAVQELLRLRDALQKLSEALESFHRRIRPNDADEENWEKETLDTIENC